MSDLGHTMVTDLGCTTSIQIITELVSLGTQAVIDVGCGDMSFSRCLAEHGAQVLAIDPDPTQADLNRAADPIPNLRYKQAGAESLPLSDQSVDGIFFSFSLHHVPAASYPKVFAEIFRSLKPSGYLCIIEPTNCPLNEVMKFFHDEDIERAAAQIAMTQFAVPAFETHSVFRYHSHTHFDSFDAFAHRYGHRSFNPSYTEADIRQPHVQEAFERLGAPDYKFEAPKQMMLCQRLKATQTGTVPGL